MPPQDVKGSVGGVSTTSELTTKDWQSVMEGILHTNQEQGRQQIESTIRYFQKEGKLPTFIHTLEQILQYARSEQNHPSNS